MWRRLRIGFLPMCLLPSVFLLSCANENDGQAGTAGDVSMAIGGTEWKREGPTMRLGNPEAIPAWAGVDAPISVVRTASKFLADEPGKWRVNNMPSCASQGKHVVCLSGKQRRHLVFLLLPDKWVLLNHPKGIPHISYVLETYIQSPRELEDPAKVSSYVEAVAFLFKGPYRVVLSRAFIRAADKSYQSSGQQDQPLSVWLAGKEKNPDALRSLCADPVVALERDAFEIHCNVITSSGSVEEWKLKGKSVKPLILVDVVVKQTREEGTFSYGYVPSD